MNLMMDRRRLHDIVVVIKLNRRSLSPGLPFRHGTNRPRYITATVPECHIRRGHQLVHVREIKVLRGKLRDELSIGHLHQVPVQRLSQLDRVQFLLNLTGRLQLLMLLVLPGGVCGRCRLQLLDEVALRGHDEGGGGGRELHLSVAVHYAQQLLWLSLLQGLCPVRGSMACHDQWSGGGQLVMVGRLAQDELHALRCVLLDEHWHLVVVVMVRGHDQLRLSGGKEDRGRGIGGGGRLDVIVVIGRSCEDRSGRG